MSRPPARAWTDLAFFRLLVYFTLAPGGGGPGLVAGQDKQRANASSLQSKITNYSKADAGSCTLF